MDKPMRVVLADDHEMFRAGLRRLLTEEPGVEVIGEAADGLSAVRLVTDLAPDVVVMDLAMPGMDGVSATRQILTSLHDSPPKVVALSSFSDEHRRSAMFQAGAVAYVVKHAAFEELTTALREVAAGRPYVSPTLAPYELPSAPGDPAASPAGPLDDPALSPRQRDTLRYLLEGDSEKQVARKLGLSRHTVHLYVTALYRHFDVHSRGELLAKLLKDKPGPPAA